MRRLPVTFRTHVTLLHIALSYGRYYIVTYSPWTLRRSHTNCRASLCKADSLQSDHLTRRCNSGRWRHKAGQRRLRLDAVYRALYSTSLTRCPVRPSVCPSVGASTRSSTCPPACAQATCIHRNCFRPVAVNKARSFLARTRLLLSSVVTRLFDRSLYHYIGNVVNDREGHCLAHLYTVKLWLSGACGRLRTRGYDFELPTINKLNFIVRSLFDNLIFTRLNN